MIYFIQQGGYVKIGRAQDPHARCRDLACGSPEPLSLVMTMVVDKRCSPGCSCNGEHVADAEAERALHQRFRHLRHRGEWFRVEGELKALLDRAGDDDFVI
jgi:hypothetical protein